MSWIGTKHLIVSRLIERMDVSTGYKEHIKLKKLTEAVPRSGDFLIGDLFYAG